MKKSICVIGLGYIGLPTAAMFASKDHKVTGVDLNQNVVDELNNGRILIEENGLPELVKNVVACGNLKGSTTPVHADVFIICVQTPINSDKSANMRFVKSATESIVPFLKAGNIVILESTSPPKTVENLMLPILEKSGLKIGEELLVAHSPERIIPGEMLKELVEDDRVVGGINEPSAVAVKELYESFVEGKIFTTDSTTAEMCKLIENTYRDINIAFANELGKICEASQVNVWEVIKFANMHPRVNIHQPGPGVGGHCIPVVPWFMVEFNPELSNIIALARKTNDGMPNHVANRILEIVKGIENPKITILGATYKQDTDDVRDSTIIEIAEILKDYNVTIYDPHVKKYSDGTVYEACKDSHLVVLGVQHSCFKNIDFALLKETMAQPNIFDTRNFWTNLISDKGFNFYLLGSGK